MIKGSLLSSTTTNKLFQAKNYKFLQGHLSYKSFSINFVTCSVGKLEFDDIYKDFDSILHQGQTELV